MAQFQPVPAAAVIPVAGYPLSDRVTSIVPLLGAEPAFRTTIVYVPEPPDLNGAPTSETTATRSTVPPLVSGVEMATELFAVFVSDPFSTDALLPTTSGALPDGGIGPVETIVGRAEPPAAAAEVVHTLGDSEQDQPLPDAPHPVNGCGYVTVTVPELGAEPVFETVKV